MLLSIRTITPKDDNARRKVEKKNINHDDGIMSGPFLSRIMSKKFCINLTITFFIFESLRSI